MWLFVASPAAYKPEGAGASEFKFGFERDVSPEIYELAAAMEGTFSAEYGIGRTKLDLARQYGTPHKNELMCQIKRALDPRCILNPGKVIA